MSQPVLMLCIAGAFIATFEILRAYLLKRFWRAQWWCGLYIFALPHAFLLPLVLINLNRYGLEMWQVKAGGPTLLVAGIMVSLVLFLALTEENGWVVVSVVMMVTWLLESTLIRQGFPIKGSVENTLAIVWIAETIYFGLWLLLIERKKESRFLTRR